jgi:hypothetical protein
MSEQTNNETVVGCPFCGGTPTVKRLQGCGHMHLVACRNATCPVAPSVIGAPRAEALRRWNTREAKTQIEQINASCQTREQRTALAVGRAVLAELQRRLEHDLRDGDTTRGNGEQ